MSNNQIKKKNLLIICRGAGDLATGIIHRLHRAGHRVIALETDYPAAIRRQVSFCEAVYDGSATVEGLTARLLPALNDAETISGINDTPQAHIASQKWKSSAIEAVLDPSLITASPSLPEISVHPIELESNVSLNVCALAVSVPSAKSATKSFFISLSCLKLIKKRIITIYPSGLEIH